MPQETQLKRYFNIAHCFLIHNVFSMIQLKPNTQINHTHIKMFSDGFSYAFHILLKVTCYF